MLVVDIASWYLEHGVLCTERTPADYLSKKEEHWATPCIHIREPA